MMLNKQALISVASLIAHYAFVFSAFSLFVRYRYRGVPRAIGKLPFGRILIGVPPRLTLLIVGGYLVFIGLVLRTSAVFTLKFLSGFLVVSGLQVLLWCIGVRLELLGNTPLDE